MQHPTRSLTHLGARLLSIGRSLSLVACLAIVPSAAYAGPQTVIVSPTPGNAVQSGNDLLATLGAITNNSWNRRYVIVLEPGVYDLGVQTLQMKEFVDVAGSGIEAVLLKGDGNTSLEGLSRGLVQGADNAELRDMTLRVFPQDGRSFLLPILNLGTSPRLRNLRVQAFGGDEYCGGITGFGTESWIEDVQIRSTCFSGLAIGIALDGGDNRRPTIREVDVVVRNNGSTGSAWALLSQFGTAPAYVRDSQFVASGGNDAVGFMLRNTLGALPEKAIAEISDSVFRGKGGQSSNAGIRNSFSTLNLRFDHGTASGSGAGQSVGIDYQNGFGGIEVGSSQVFGETTSAVGNPFGIVRIGSSQVGGGQAGADVICAGSYDETYAFFAGTCPP